jgi:hypothetical protein
MGRAPVLMSSQQITYIIMLLLYEGGSKLTWTFFSFTKDVSTNTTKHPVADGRNTFFTSSDVAIPSASSY